MRGYAQLKAAIALWRLRTPYDEELRKVVTGHYSEMKLQLGRCEAMRQVVNILFVGWMVVRNRICGLEAEAYRFVY